VVFPSRCELIFLYIFFSILADWDQRSQNQNRRLKENPSQMRREEADMKVHQLDSPIAHNRSQVTYKNRHYIYSVLVVFQSGRSTQNHQSISAVEKFPKQYILYFSKNLAFFATITAKKKNRGNQSETKKIT
jgi:hypothetical protein